MNRKKYTIVLAFAAVLAIGFVTVPRIPMRAAANSAPHFWEGAAGVGVIGKDACPLVVEHERLTFDIDTLPDDGGGISDGYDARVTATYTFYNPTDEDITATLDFPFGDIPYYGDGADVMRDLARYDITVDGVAVHKTLRYTPSDYRFDAENDLSLLLDTYVEDRFFAPDLPVTAHTYTFAVPDAQTLADGTAVATIDFSCGDRTAVAYRYARYARTSFTAETLQLRAYVEDGASITVYVVGEPLETMPQWTVCNDRNETVFATVTESETRTMTWEDALLQDCSDTDPVSRIDLYNARLSLFARSNPRLNRDDEQFLMHWYEYRMTVPAKTRVENSVTAPLYPSGNFAYSPTIYQYIYLLSPAQNWAAFGDLDIVIETPYYCTESGFGSGYPMHTLDTEAQFEQTDTGYVLHLDGLPDGELSFTLCTSPNPEIVRNYGAVFGYTLLFIFALPFWLYANAVRIVFDNPLTAVGIAVVVAVVLAIFVAVLAVVQRRQKKNAKHYVLRKEETDKKD